jgi:hypothetical protein
MRSMMRLAFTVFGTATFGVATLGGSALAALPSPLPDEPAGELSDPACEAGTQSLVYDDQGVAHWACVAQEGPAPAEPSTTTIAALVGSGALPTTGRGTDSAALGVVLVSLGMLCRCVSRRGGSVKAFRAETISP